MLIIKVICTLTFVFNSLLCFPVMLKRVVRVKVFQMTNQCWKELFKYWIRKTFNIVIKKGLRTEVFTVPMTLSKLHWARFRLRDNELDFDFIVIILSISYLKWKQIIFSESLNKKWWSVWKTPWDWDNILELFFSTQSWLTSLTY